MPFVNKALVQKLLESPLNVEWTLQGLGMLRCYLTPDSSVRLHVWTTDNVVDEVSTLHTHPWDFRSDVIAGVVNNTRYSKNVLDGSWENWQEQKIKCGVGGCLVGKPEIVVMRQKPTERYTEGMSYQQTAPEIHESTPEDGSVTIITRKFGADTEHAYVYFPVGAEWVSAEPRPAERDEILKITVNALERWFA